MPAGVDHAEVKYFGATQKEVPSTAILALPGILSDYRTWMFLDGDETSGLLGLMRAHSDVYCVNYPRYSFRGTKIVHQTAEEIKYLLGYYQQVDVYGASIGGKIAYAAIASLSHELSQKDFLRLRLVMVDSPITSQDLGLGGNIAAPLLNGTKFVPWVMELPGLRSISYPAFMMGLPKPEETQADLDFEAVCNEAKRRQTGYTLGVYLQQIAWMAKPLTAYGSVREGVKITYVRCTNGNVTVNDSAVQHIKELVNPKDLAIVEVASPHVAILQEPDKWREALTQKEV